MEEDGMYEEKIRVDLIELSWDEEAWIRFLEKLNRIYSKMEAGELGELFFCNQNGRFSNYQIQTYVRTFVSGFLDKEDFYKRYEIADPKQQKLPLSVQVESDTYLRYSMRLAILQAIPEMAEWLLQFFINIRFVYRKQADDFFFFEEELEEVLEMEHYSYLEIDGEGSVIHFLRAHIDSQQYISIYLDDFYIEEKDYYRSRHHVKETLVYGYDDEKEVFLAYGFARDQKVYSFTVGYMEMIMAYVKGKVFSFFGGSMETGEVWPATSYFPKQPVPFQFTADVLREKLSEYLVPKRNELIQNDLYVYGYNVVVEIIQNLRSTATSDFLDYRALNLLYEQKRSIKKRMYLLQIRKEIPGHLRHIISSYDTIVFAFRGIQVMYLHQSRKESVFWDYEKRVRDREVRERLAEEIERYSLEEHAMLLRMKQELENL